MTPTSRARVSSDNGEIIVRLAYEASLRGYREAYRLVKNLRKALGESEFRKIRKNLNLNNR